MGGKMSSSNHDDLDRPRVEIFSNFRKKARDILNKDYYNNYNHPNNKQEIVYGLGTSSNHAHFLFNTYPDGEIQQQVQEQGQVAQEEGQEQVASGFSLGEFTATASNENSSVEIKTNAELNGFSAHVVAEIVPKTLNGFISMKFPDLDGTSKAGIQCFFPPYATLTASTFTSTTLKDNFSTFHYSGSIGYGKFSMGGDFVISDPSSSNPYPGIKDYSGGIRFMNSDFDATVGFSDKGATLNASCVYYLDAMKKKKKKSSIMEFNRIAVAEFKRNLSSDEHTLTIGGVMELAMETDVNYYKMTLLKAKVDNHGKIGVVMQQQLLGDTKIRICGEFDHKDFMNSIPKVGLSLIL